MGVLVGVSVLLSVGSTGVPVGVTGVAVRASVGGISVGVAVAVGVGVCATVVKLNVVVSLIPQ